MASFSKPFDPRPARKMASKNRGKESSNVVSIRGMALMSKESTRQYFRPFLADWRGIMKPETIYPKNRRDPIIPMRYCLPQ